VSGKYIEKGEFTGKFSTKKDYCGYLDRKRLKKKGSRDEEGG
jgi:hypothetical protein